MIASEKTKRTLLPEECPQRARVTRRLTATRTSPEVLRKWRGRESSPGSGPRDSPSRLLLQSVALRVCVDARYSGGAAPASNRFPWLPFAINCWGEAIYVSAPAQAPESSCRRSIKLARPCSAGRSTALTEEAREDLSPPLSSWACPKRGSGGSCARRR